MSHAVKLTLLSLMGSAWLALALHPGTASAQVDLSGNWAPAQGFVQLIPNGPPSGDFLGVPLNREGRAMAATANPEAESEEPGRQCQLWLVDYLLDGPFGIQIQPIGDRLNASHVLAWHLGATVDRPAVTVWVDGRKPPPAAALHTWAGFAVGHWRGDTLAVSITHLVDGWMLRNDAPQSDRATVSMFLSREGNLLTMTYIIHDPVYLSAPYIRAKTFRLSAASPTHSIGSVNDCLPAEVLPGLNGYQAARYLPGQSPLLTFMKTHYGIPTQIALGGPQQMYPAFQRVVARQYMRPAGYCHVNCCAALGIRGTHCPAPMPAPPVTDTGTESSTPRTAR